MASPAPSVVSRSTSNRLSTSTTVAALCCAVECCANQAAAVVPSRRWTAARQEPVIRTERGSAGQQVPLSDPATIIQALLL